MSINALRTQIVETQRARSDLMKWKLLLVAGLGTVVLGVEKVTVVNQQLILALIPMVCVYVDSLCAHLSLRIFAIGQFIASQVPKTDDEKYAKAYEQFIRTNPTPKYRLEQLALHWSTGFLSAIVSLAAYFLFPIKSTQPGEILLPFNMYWIVFFSSFFGIGLTIYILKYDEHRRDDIINKAKKELEDQSQNLSRSDD